MQHPTMKSLKEIHTRYFAPAFFIFIIINYLLFFYEPGQGSGRIPYADKIVHFILFATFSFSVFYGCFKSSGNLVKSNLLLLFVLAVVAYAGLTEIIQYFFVEHRSGEWADFFSDVLGICTGFFLLDKLKRFF